MLIPLPNLIIIGIKFNLINISFKINVKTGNKIHKKIVVIINIFCSYNKHIILKI